MTTNRVDIVQQTQTTVTDVTKVLNPDGVGGVAWGAGGMTNPMTTQDDIIVGGASGVPGRLAKGSDGQVLTVDPSTHHLLWATPGSALLTTKGDLYGHSTVDARIPIGTNGQVLTADSTQTLGLAWAATSLSNPMTTKGDVILGDTGGTPTRLGAGTAAYVLTSNGAAAFPSWQAPSGGGGDAITGQTGGGGAQISGLQGSRDIVVAGTNDDEFDAAGLSGWTVLGSPTHDADTTVKGHYYVKSSGTGNGWEGIVKAIPSTTSVFTIAVKDFLGQENYQKFGIVLAELSTGGKMEAMELGCPGAFWKLNVESYTSRTSGGGGIAAASVEPAFRPPLYLRAQLLSATSVSYWFSFGGTVWTRFINAHTPAFTIGYVGIAADTESSGILQQGLVDWFRVT